MMPTFGFQGLDDPQKKMSTLEQENFDLKLRLYHMKQTGSDQNIGVKVEETAEQLADILETHCVDNMALRESNDTARKRINELESELMQLRIKREGKYTIDASNGNLREIAAQAVLPQTRTSNPVLDENRRRERQATVAIAQHDAQLIRKLESEVSNLRTQHDSDISLVNDCADKIGNLVREVEDKDQLIHAQNATSQQLQEQIDLMRDQLRRHELMLEHQVLQRQLAQATNANATSSSPSRRAGTLGTTTNSASPHRTSSRSPHGSPSPHVHVHSPDSLYAFDTRTGSSSGSYINNVNSKKETILSRPLTVDVNDLMSYGITGSSSRTNSNSNNKTYRNPLDAFVQTDTATASRSSARATATGSSTSRMTNNNIATAASSAMIDSPSGIAGAELSYSKLLDEVNNLRQDNSRLKQQVARERAMLKGQEEVLNKVRASAEEITLLEAEEIARLEAELDRCNEEREQWQRKSRAAEGRAEQYRMQILRLERDLNPSSIPGPPIIPGLSAATDPRIMEMYKQREAELLHALEGVVLRCQDLESRMDLQNQIQTNQQLQPQQPPSPNRAYAQTNSSSSSNAGYNNGFTGRTTSPGGKPTVVGGNSGLKSSSGTTSAAYYRGGPSSPSTYQQQSPSTPQNTAATAGQSSGNNRWRRT